MKTTTKIKTKGGVIIEKTADEKNYEKFMQNLHNLVENKTVSEVYGDVEEIVVNVTLEK